jgi:hypothetical protein
MENESPENGEYISTNPLFKSLTAEEVNDFREHARENFIPELLVNPVWHPVYRHECDKISAESRADREAKWQHQNPKHIPANMDGY